ncbi:hypothetical protein A3G48_01240 [Candidatus Nomurabacteria bacterium RIFCSPLOWO2_12_FULL_40_42]|nr:MAG: hypothetical protein UU01_C0016G0001 [Parcubacteria group bacterium GW2011_GWA2_40_37]OGI62873.1 MAG: hypothetical protein A2W12_02945 [Candidatus Nomurabacteria bacterium RBG_16_40_11]OGI78244.1 MAG: hypothetical protein A3C65_03125 [Candidatus Nomurabacteria bacterium RIFCSPHIGHO2_02_FULL_41_150]OGJ02773.1 MAG: hypothetical protein A3G48_01240 [Candidatus Nomurabacteria bacterium RIFCSPLOWO2_12_FULL_40_42]
MNFKFTKIKSIVVLSISFLVGIYFFVVSPGIILDGTTSLTQLILNKSIFFFFWFIPTYIVLYVLLSLFQRK